MAKKEYEPDSEPMSVEDVQETIAEAMALIGELQGLVERSQHASGNPVTARPRKAIDPLTERRIERLQDKLRDCNRAVAELRKQGTSTESLAKRLMSLGEAAIKLFVKLFGGGASP